MDHGLLDNLYGLLLDTYESNQLSALKCLKFYADNKIIDQETMAQYIRIAFETADSHLNSSNVDHPMAAAYLLMSLSIDPKQSLDLVASHIGIMPKYTFKNSTSDRERLSLHLLDFVHERLVAQAKQAQSSLVVASVSAPLYPSLLAIRYLLRDSRVSEEDIWKSKISDILELIQTVVYPTVCPVVCHSSPEGYIPKDALDEMPEIPVAPLAGGDMSSRPSLPQYLVVCCWRTIREVSLLFAELMTSCVRNSKSSLPLLSPSQVREIRNCYEHILLNAKHRGAFEMAYTGYCDYWKAVWRLPYSNELVREFLDEGPYSILQDRDRSDQLCATRRSAGLPFLILAVLTSELNENSLNMFTKITKELLQMAAIGSAPTTHSGDGENPSDNQAVHSLNVLRFIFLNSSLSEKVHPFVTQGLKTAISGYKSKLWSVRNASTLLYAALVNRMFGVKQQGQNDLSKRNGMAARLFFQKYPGVQPFLLQELVTSSEFKQTDSGVQLQPSLYLVLLILCKLYPSPTDGREAEYSLNPFIPLIIRCASSPVYKARMLAARALSNTCSYDQLQQVLAYNTDHLSQPVNSNRCHGLLLQLHFLLDNVNEKCAGQIESIYTNIIREFVKNTADTYISSSCPHIRSVYLDVLTKIAATLPALISGPVPLQHLVLSCLAKLHPEQQTVDEILTYVNLLITLPSSGAQLCSVLRSPNQYEAHQLIISKLLEGKLSLPVHDLVSTFNSWVDDLQIGFSQTSAVSIYKLCGFLGSLLTRADEASLVTSHRVLYLLEVSHTTKVLSVLQLASRISKLQPPNSHGELSSDDLIRRLHTEMSKQLVDEEQMQCLEVMENLVLTLGLSDDSVCTKMKLYKCFILAAFSHSDTVRTSAAERIPQLLNRLHPNVSYEEEEDIGLSSHHLLPQIITKICSTISAEEAKAVVSDWAKVSTWDEKPTDLLTPSTKVELKLFENMDSPLVCDINYITSQFAAKLNTL